MAQLADIIAAIRAGDIPRVGQLLEDDPGLANARSDAGEPALLLAIYHRQREAADLLVGAGAEIDVFTAAAGGYLDHLRDAVEGGSASVNAFSQDGWTPLHLAAFFGQTAAAMYLLTRRADVTAVSRNETGNTPLHAAVAARQTALAELLLGHGADVNASSGGGWRPLHLAADNGDLQSIGLLLSKGAGVNPLSSDGKTPLSMAQAKDRREAVELLRRHGAT
jgi:ankyrin repeat protein